MKGPEVRRGCPVDRRAVACAVTPGRARNARASKTCDPQDCEVITCANCGTENDADSVFCGACNHFLQWDDPVPEPRSRRRRTSADLAAAIGASTSEPDPVPEPVSRPATGPTPEPEPTEPEPTRESEPTREPEPTPEPEPGPESEPEVIRPAPEPEVIRPAPAGGLGRSNRGLRQAQGTAPEPEP